MLYQIGRQNVQETYENSVVDYINLISNDRDPIESLREDIIAMKRSGPESESFYQGIDEAFVDAVIEDLVYSSISDNQEITDLIINWLYKYIVYNIHDDIILDLLNFDIFVADIPLTISDLVPVARTHAQIFSLVQSYFSEEPRTDPVRIKLSNILTDVGSALRSIFRQTSGIESNGRLNRLFREYLTSYSTARRLTPRSNMDTYLPASELTLRI